MSIFKHIGAALEGSKPIDEMAEAYPHSALNPAQDFANYPAKVFLGTKNIFAYRLDFMVSEPDAARVVHAVGTEFALPSPATFQEGHIKKGSLSLHFSSRPEFGGAVIVIVTNSIPLLNEIDALDLAPPPPWIVFPDADPSALGSLQGAMEYWFDWHFFPFWNSADTAARSHYLAKHGASKAWLEFVALHAP